MLNITLLYSLPRSTGLLIPAERRYNKDGGYCLDSFYSGAGSILYTWNLGSTWQQYTTTISLPDNATHLSLESSLRCYGCPAGQKMSATWHLADISVTRLDLSLRNVIRTNVTDIELMGSGPDANTRYVEGIDYTVEAPQARNKYSHKYYIQALNSRELNLTVQMPCVLKRVAGGRIAAGAVVRLSYDYLPG